MTAGTFGGLHAAFSNAGTGPEKPGSKSEDLEEWRKRINLYIMALLYTARASLSPLRKTCGHPVLTGSVARKVHIPGSIYSASKWFVHCCAGKIAQEMSK